MASTTHASPSDVVERLVGATNDHDLAGIVGCFAPDYRNETPAHPTRGFVGRDQVRRNWTQILHAVPDVAATVLRVAVDGNTVWTEQEHRGTRPDGRAHLMRGVVIFGISDGAITWARFYLEPVQAGGGSVDEVIARQLGAGGAA
jgi:ketosteroid isomerase-like protein